MSLCPLVSENKKRGLNSLISDSAVFHNLVPYIRNKAHAEKQRGRQILFLGDDLNLWKFQNPEIKANAFYLYVF